MLLRSIGTTVRREVLQVHIVRSNTEGQGVMRRSPTEKMVWNSAARMDWSAYATQYDEMAGNNPAYQELLSHCVQTVRNWALRPGDVIADMAAGTGNFSLAIAKALPRVSVLHVELNDVMIGVAERKASEANVRNWKVVQLDLMEHEWPVPEVSGLVLIHALATLPHPRQVITSACAKLREGGHLYAADVGRAINSTDWGKELLCASLKKNGLLGTMSLFRHTGIVRRENKRGARLRRNGIYWSHELPEFRAAFEGEGMEVVFASNDFYRGYDDLIVARKR